VSAETADVSWELERIRRGHRLPALAAAAVADGEIVAFGASGRRRVGRRERVTLTDKWELASCTKSMTAAVAAMLVEDGVLRWDSTIGQTFQNDTSLHSEWSGVTLEQLLLHRGGAPRTPPVAS